MQCSISNRNASHNTGTGSVTIVPGDGSHKTGATSKGCRLTNFTLSANHLVRLRHGTTAVRGINARKLECIAVFCCKCCWFSNTLIKGGQRINLGID